MTLLYEELSGAILGSCFEISNELGPGFLESVYEKALLVALRQKGLSARSQVPLAVFFRGENVGDFFADIIVEEKIILELKTCKALTPEHQAQLINYLNATKMNVGLLINFGTPKLEYKRLHRF